ncbi:MAG: Txe/YoeB family addiction module toxin [Ferruginibacter sp.]
MASNKIINIQPKAWDDMQFWLLNDRKILTRIFELVNAVTDNPFTGIGKPEPLKHIYKGYWSRRINEEHRLIYKINDNEIVIISCKGHY